MSLATRAVSHLSEHGSRPTIGKAASALVRRLRKDPTDPLFAHRRMLGDRLFTQFGGTVQEGPLKGFRLSVQPKWCAADRGTMILGLYEAQVLQQLVEFGSPNRTLVDIGAADGYFGIGCVAAGLFPRSVCFEMDRQMRASLHDVAAANGVADRVTILGTADHETVPAALKELGLAPSDCVILCDIEGAEFDLLDADMLASLAGAHLIIELHEGNLDGGVPARGDALVDQLVSAAQGCFTTRLLNGGDRNPYDHPVLRDWRDDDRWLLCSEGRNIYQRWLVLEPRWQ